MWTARRSNQSILKEISPGCSLEGLILKLQLQYFGVSLMQRADSLKDPDAGKDLGQEEKGMTENEMAGCIIDSIDMGLGELRELVTDRRHGVLWFMGSQRVRHVWATELNWLMYTYIHTRTDEVGQDNSYCLQGLVTEELVGDWNIISFSSIVYFTLLPTLILKIKQKFQLLWNKIILSNKNSFAISLCWWNETRIS